MHGGDSLEASGDSDGTPQQLHRWPTATARSYWLRLWLRQSRTEHSRLSGALWLGQYWLGTLRVRHRKIRVGMKR